MTRELPRTSIRDYEQVPDFVGRALIRLPRCQNCYDEVHDYRDGNAACLPISGSYCRMGAEMLGRWQEAERTDAETRPLDVREEA